MISINSFQQMHFLSHPSSSRYNSKRQFRLIESVHFLFCFRTQVSCIVKMGYFFAGHNFIDFRPTDNSHIRIAPFCVEMYWFAGTAIAQLIISTTKWLILSKILKKGMDTRVKRLFFSLTSNKLLTYYTFGNQSMIVQNQLPRGVDAVLYKT